MKPIRDVIPAYDAARQKVLLGLHERRKFGENPFLR
jgi:hypothetical protein